MFVGGMVTIGGVDCVTVVVPAGFVSAGAAGGGGGAAGSVVEEPVGVVDSGSVGEIGRVNTSRGIIGLSAEAGVTGNIIKLAIKTAAIVNLVILVFILHLRVIVISFLESDT